MKTIQSIAHATPPEINAASVKNLSGVITWSSPVVATCTSTVQATPVFHDLGVIPTDISVSPWVNGSWWADINDRRMWTDKAVVFHVSAVGQYTVRVGIA